ncbi:Bug family tripartite tricarboxylate transporter substrate binding protein [Paracandidimonas soli]|uniref:Tripartite-type tricarboxylate transporter receptor subunit TctC n=1 Tax=Paracandidimonas soli TaxID=1917182 RepID=A0A4R3VCH5_9BURK|nr:tripartite tricarboxylate transporter substrate-binding protein [Paracandidimonas soli]TCV03026.1 tripartite-type tricarboxylate transporter receptor subunit TctC [Paracandidimonas soli]
MKTIKTLFAVASLSLAALPLQAVHAQSKSTQNHSLKSPIHLIHGQAPGGTTDAMARLLAQELTKRLNVDVVVETRPGAGTTLAAAAVARAPADGQTVLFTGSGHSVNASLIPNLTFDTAKDFKAIGMVAATPYLLLTTPSMPVSNVKELVSYLKQNPDKATVAVTSIGSSPHIAGALFRQKSGVEMELVPYKGSSAQVADVISGRVPVAFDNIALMGPHLEAKTLKPLAVTSQKRSPMYPDIPTMEESGFPDFDIVGWFGALVPTKTPDDVVAVFNQVVLEMKKDPAFIAQVQKLGATIMPGGSAEAEEFVQNDIKKMTAMVKELGITLK